MGWASTRSAVTSLIRQRNRGGTSGRTRNQAMNNVLPDPATNEGELMRVKSGNWGSESPVTYLATFFAALDVNGLLSLEVMPVELSDALVAIAAQNAEIITQLQTTNELLVLMLTKTDETQETE